MNRLPVIFFGHGNPMNALADNEYTRAWRQMGEEVGKPKAILCISAHWYTQATAVTVAERPRTIHDFGGFPRALFEMNYPAPGHAQLARDVQDLLQPLEVAADVEWGLDHGTWAVLCHVYPQADVPVVQLSIDERLPARDHYEIGRKLAPLRDRGVLIVGSGNLVHNLHAYAWGSARCRTVRLGCALRIAGKRMDGARRSRTLDQLRIARQGRCTFGTDAGTLFTAALRTRCPTTGRLSELSGCGHRWRLGVDAECEDGMKRTR